MFTDSFRFSTITIQRAVIYTLPPRQVYTASHNHLGRLHGSCVQYACCDVNTPPVRYTHSAHLA